MENLTLTNREKFMLNFGGFDTETIAKTSSAEKKRAINMSLSLLVPVLLGACSGGYAVAMISNDWRGWLFGPVYALIVYLIDRALISISNQSVWVFVMRIVLAIVVGLVISFPIKLLVFNDAIQEELHADLQKKQNSMEAITNAQIESLEKQISEKEKISIDYNKTWYDEMDGSGGSEDRGRGSISDAKEIEYRAKLADYKTFEAAKKVEISNLQSKLAQDLENMKNAHATGLLGRYKALGQVAEREAFVKNATYLLWAFFTLLELIPLLIKMASSGSLYDRAIESEHTAKLVSINETNVLKAEAETLATKKTIQHSMNKIKVGIAMDDVNTETEMAKMYINKLVEISKIESKKSAEVLKDQHIDEAAKETLVGRINEIADFYADRIYQTPFSKSELYDQI